MTTESQGLTETRVFPAPTQTGTYRVVGVPGADQLTTTPDDGMNISNSTNLQVIPSEGASNSGSQQTTGTIFNSATAPPASTVASKSGGQSNLPSQSTSLTVPSPAVSSGMSTDSKTIVIIGATLGTVTFLAIIVITVLVFVLLRRRGVRRMIAPDTLQRANDSTNLFSGISGVNPSNRIEPFVLSSQVSSRIQLNEDTSDSGYVVSSISGSRNVGRKNLDMRSVSIERGSAVGLPPPSYTS
ncbi:hypothetical protein K435DRAFT_869259 [Dendrothele bispora CBS 962.96]|uniref:Mid2 domain-containing protein n=1 Tax=Dendrothele bispora (strain CBS 962.96) TaxID=1314807 RepID=A0A4S8LA34_DENBC|nr:hypothetical protein K435DRAFT_869259 [Dendrothele bispora CBS 962.96]